MIDLNEIEDEIRRLEHSDTNYSNCEKLSILYTVRDGLTTVNNMDSPTTSYSYAPAPSEFMETFNKAPEEALKVLDDHMEAMKIVYPREYKKIIDRLSVL